MCVGFEEEQFGKKGRKIPDTLKDHEDVHELAAQLLLISHQLLLLLFHNVMCIICTLIPPTLRAAGS